MPPPVIEWGHYAPIVIRVVCPYSMKASLFCGLHGSHSNCVRAELVERGFGLTLDRGGMHRTWLRGRKKVLKRYLIHVAGHNLDLIMRLLTGQERRGGSQREPPPGLVPS